MDEFDIDIVSVTKSFSLMRKTDGRFFACIQYHDVNLNVDGEIIEAYDDNPVTKEEEEAVKKAVQEFLQK